MVSPLTPSELSQLKRLLAKAEQLDSSEEEKRLREEQEKLAQQEAAAAANLAELQSTLDRTTTALEAAIRKRLAAREHGAPQLMRDFRHFAEHLAAALPTELKGVRPEELVLGMQIMFDGMAERLDARSARPAPRAAYDTALDDQLTDRQREQTARAIIDAGKRRRNEPVVPLDPHRRNDR